MAWNLDARIPLRVFSDPATLAEALAAGPPAALLVEAPPAPLPDGAVAQASFDPFMSHEVACTCCDGRSPAATALDRLFQARIRGQCPWFERVLAMAETPEAQASLQAALHEDALTSARFRPALRPRSPEVKHRGRESSVPDQTAIARGETPRA
jgi:hypothetical protein